MPPLKKSRVKPLLHTEAKTKAEPKNTTNWTKQAHPDDELMHNGQATGHQRPIVKEV